MTTVAIGFCTSAPVPVASAMGTNPSEATRAVMTTGRRRVSAPTRIASILGVPSCINCRMKLSITSPLRTATPDRAMNPTAAETEKVMSRSHKAAMPPVSASGTAPGNFAQLATAYMAAHNVGAEDLKKAIGHVSWKSHQNGAKNPKAHLQKAVEMDTILNAPMIASPLGLFDCCGVSDGAAAAIVTTPEIAKSLGKHDIVSVKALQLSVSNGSESGHNSWDGSYFHTTRIASKKAYEEAGIKSPRDEVSMFEVHDCFSVTELVTMEDLHISETGKGWKDVLDGFYDADGKIPCQIDGGLKCFGHPIGASGLRMLYEMYLQFQGRAGARQLKDPRIGMTHNLGGAPRENVSSVAIVGRYE